MQTYEQLIEESFGAGRFTFFVLNTSDLNLLNIARVRSGSLMPDLKRPFKQFHHAMKLIFFLEKMPEVLELF